MSSTQVFTISALEFAPAATKAFRRRMALARSKDKTAKLALPKSERREQASQMVTSSSAAELVAHVLGQPMPANRRFPPPWSVEEQAACYVVRDANG
jgi:hypothetical protein